MLSTHQLVPSGCEANRYLFPSNRLIPKSRPDRDMDMLKVWRVEVSIAARIAQKYTFTHFKRIIFGQEGDGQVAFKMEKDRLQIFMTSNYNLSTHAPFTISNREASFRTTEFLAQCGFSDAETWAWRASHPTYHFDIAVSPGELASELERVSLLWPPSHSRLMRSATSRIKIANKPCVRRRR